MSLYLTWLTSASFWKAWTLYSVSSCLLLFDCISLFFKAHFLNLHFSLSSLDSLRIICIVRALSLTAILASHLHSSPIFPPTQWPFPLVVLLSPKISSHLPLSESLSLPCHYFPSTQLSPKTFKLSYFSFLFLFLFCLLSF